jgi:hypothetical protein
MKKSGLVKKSVKFLNPTQGLPHIPRAALNLLKAIDNPHMGRYRKRRKYNIPGRASKKSQRFAIILFKSFPCGMALPPIDFFIPETFINTPIQENNYIKSKFHFLDFNMINRIPILVNKNFSGHVLKPAKNIVYLRDVSA